MPSLLETAIEPFAGCTGKGVRVAVIDSGVNADHPHIIRVAGGVSVGTHDQFDGENYTDHLGHGTAVMAAIQEKAPDADYIAVKLFDASLRTRTEYLLTAIDWALDQGVQVINLSLGTRRMEFQSAFVAAIERAAAKGTSLIAPCEANGVACLPGALPGVISVGLDWNCPRNAYRAEGGFFYASGYPRSLPGRPVERNLMGISFAVANMTGFVVRVLQSSRQNLVRTLLDSALMIDQPGQPAVSR